VATRHRSTARRFVSSVLMGKEPSIGDNRRPRL
jgi:hypothetical protein